MADGFIPPHGGYAHLLSYRKAEIIYDATSSTSRSDAWKRTSSKMAVSVSARPVPVLPNATNNEKKDRNPENE